MRFTTLGSTILIACWMIPACIEVFVAYSMSRLPKISLVANLSILISILYILILIIFHKVAKLMLVQQSHADDSGALTKYLLVLMISLPISVVIFNFFDN